MIMYGLKTVQTSPETGRKLFWYDGSDSAGSEFFGVDLAVITHRNPWITKVALRAFRPSGYQSSPARGIRSRANIFRKLFSAPST